MPAENPSTPVLILAPATLSRLAWAALLAPQPGLAVWGQASGAEEIRSLPAAGGPVAVLLDVPRPAPGLVEALLAALPQAGPLCLVDDHDLPQTIALLRAGAIGILSRDASLPELARALIAAGRGEIVLPPALAARALAALARGEVTSDGIAEALTERESDVLALLARGMTNKEIAQTLFLSVRTVEAHLRNIYGKLGVGSRTEAVLWAVQHGAPPDLGNST